MPTRPLPAILYGLVLWVAAAGWTVAASTIPGFREVRSLPYLSNDLAVSVPVIILWGMLASWFARRYLQSTGSDRAWEGYLFGQMLLTVVSALDFLVFVVALDRGDEFYYDALVWVAYALLLVVPWRVGRRIETARSPGSDALARAPFGE